MVDILYAIAEKVKEGRRPEVKELVQVALDEGVSPHELIDKGLIKGMALTGDLFKENEIFLPEMMAAANAMDTAMKLLEPLLLKSGGQKWKGKIALGTVASDVHDIGKNLVAIMLRGAGFEVTDLGVNTPTQRFVDAALNGVQVIGMSALLTTTMPHMETVIEALRMARLNGNTKTIIGGCPTSQRYADEIGADGYAEDAAAAVDKVKELLNLA
jgi:5-methyltetrahydrofolate--homocysteine methyltransferase